MKILAQRPTHISAVAAVLLITKTFTVKYHIYIYRERVYINTMPWVGSRPDDAHGDETWREDSFGHEGSIIK